MNSFRLAALNKSGLPMSFGKTFPSLQECVSSAAVQNWKRRRAGLPEGSVVKEYKSGTIINTIPLAA